MIENRTGLHVGTGLSVLLSMWGLYIDSRDGSISHEMSQGLGIGFSFIAVLYALSFLTKSSSRK